MASEGSHGSSESLSPSQRSVGPSASVNRAQSTNDSPQGVNQQEDSSTPQRADGSSQPSIVVRPRRVSRRRPSNVPLKCSRQCRVNCRRCHQIQVLRMSRQYYIFAQDYNIGFSQHNDVCDVCDRLKGLGLQGSSEYVRHRGLESEMRKLHQLHAAMIDPEVFVIVADLGSVKL